jgi:hypothetical protein
MLKTLHSETCKAHYRSRNKFPFMLYVSEERSNLPNIYCHLKINGIAEVVKWWNGCDSISRIAMFVAGNSEDD